MFIKHIKLTNFRNYVDREFNFEGSRTLILGPNTSGKSNLLEAIFLSSYATSPTAIYDRDMINKSSAFGIVCVRTDSKDLEVQIVADGSYENVSRKRFKVNGLGKRMNEFSHNLKVVLFSPADLNLVGGPPNIRRRFLDNTISAVDTNYTELVSGYEKTKRRRNVILEKIREGEAQRDELSFWTEKLLGFGVAIQRKRDDFFAEVEKLMSDGFALAYRKSLISPERLHTYYNRELAAGMSLIGPHRDDFKFKVHDAPNTHDTRRVSRHPSGVSASGASRDLAAYGSRGEQRKAVLSLKKCALEYIKLKTGETPVLLLDDIFSELDKENREFVLDTIKDEQVVITTTDLNHVPKDILKNIQIIELTRS